MQRLQSILLLLLVLCAGSAQSAVFTVGHDQWCSTSDIQTALNAAALTGNGPHEVRINAGTWSGQALLLANLSIHVSGGWSDCGGAAVRSGSTEIHGNGNESVLRIRSTTLNVDTITLTGVALRHGGGGEDGLGGGIDATGRFLLTLREVTVADNSAASGGGGIYAAGAGGSSGGILQLLQGTTIRDNAVPTSGITHGGGLLARDAGLRVRSDRVLVTGNAAKHGGGIALIRSSLSFGSQGEPEISDSATGAVVSHNHAAHGGGIWLEGSGALLDAHELAVEYNVASVAGGGVYAGPGAQVQFQRDYPNALRAQCPAGQLCSRLLGNQAGDGCPGSSGMGGALYLDQASGFIRQTLVQGNCAWGSPGLVSFGPRLMLDSVLLVGNRYRKHAAGNYTGDRIITLGSKVGLPASINSVQFLTAWGNVTVDDAGATAPAPIMDGPSADVQLTVAASAFETGVTQFVTGAGPCNRTDVPASAFVDAAAGDFRPGARGGLADACAASQLAVDGLDPYLTPHCTDIAVADQGGSCDIGAVEAAEVLAAPPEGTTTILYAPAAAEHQVGEVVTFEVSIDGTQTRPADGQVTVTASTGESCVDASLVAGVSNRALAACSIQFKSAGTRSLTASYSGGALHLASSASAIGLSIERAVTTVRVVSNSPSIPLIGEAVTFGVLVEGGYGTVGGSVEVDAGAAGSCTATVNAGGALCELVPIASGSFVAVPVYSGDANNLPATGAGYPLHVQGEADLSVAIDNGTATVRSGAYVEYEILLHNAGPSPAFETRIEVSASEQLYAPSWQCLAPAGVECDGYNQGPFERVIDLPAGATVRYLLGVTLGEGDAPLTVTATTTTYAEGTDPVPGNDSDSDGPDRRTLFGNGFEGRDLRD